MLFHLLLFKEQSSLWLSAKSKLWHQFYEKYRKANTYIHDFFQQKCFFLCSFRFLLLYALTLRTTVRLPPAWATCPDEMTLYFLGPLSHFDFKRKKNFLWLSPGFELWSPTPALAAKPTELTCRGSWRLWSNDLTLARFATGLCREKYTASHFVQV